MLLSSNIMSYDKIQLQGLGSCKYFPYRREIPMPNLFKNEFGSSLCFGGKCSFGMGKK